MALAVAAIASATADTDRATAMVTVVVGPHAGTHVLRNSDVPCEIAEEKAPRPTHQFDVTIGALAPSKDLKKLTLLIVIVPDADVKGANHTFFTSINFGDVSHGMQYNAETRPGEKVGRSGGVMIARHGQDATVTFDVTSADGVAYEGTVQCSGVSRY